MKNVFILIILFGCFHGYFAQKITTIKGFAPNYVGKQIEIFQFMDYITMKKERIASATVTEDSTFTCSFYLSETQKLNLIAANNEATILCDPGSSYEVFVPDRNPYEPYRPAGNFIELTFFNLDSTDINYKVLEFNQWTDQFVATYYTKKNADGPYFSQRLDTFKIILNNHYLSDTSNTYFNYHRKFTMARIDGLRFLGSRNQYEKYDFYLKNTPVLYQSDAYMEYMNHYYDKFMPRVNNATNNKVYLALLKSSPTLIMKALGTEYTLQHNYKLREMVMIKILGECFFEKDYPQTNILTVLDSLQKKSLFEGNRIIAENMYLRLTQLNAGSKSPDFTIVDKGVLYNLKKYEGKHLYLIFIDSKSPSVINQLNLLVPMYQKYRNEVNFLMIIKESDALNQMEAESIKQDYPWESVSTASNSIFSSFQVRTFPSYVLIDRIGYLVAAPALGPLPNGQYETIDKTFFAIKKTVELNNEEQR